MEVALRPHVESLIWSIGVKYHAVPKINTRDDSELLWNFRSVLPHVKAFYKEEKRALLSNFIPQTESRKACSFIIDRE